MSGASGDGGGRHLGDLQLVAVSSKTGAVAEAAPAGRDGAIVEYAKSGPVLREDEEDLEVKLRRIMENVPVRVSNTSGSSAGSGSGDFHQYRQMRRKEQDRLARMNVDYQKRKEIAEFNMRREERLKAAEERTSKKRLKRQKKKQRKREKKSQAGHGGEEETRKKESSDDKDFDDNDDDDEELKK
ncbi:PRKR-interacting protein 1 homolog [Zingiber officinale]|uniref:PRKR-interacting protein 1 n=1 Tax=Zingiber officinale TaxID=94328 RepID=A0A8J5LEG9_ZINOF|nr:PRKR-interacting protein 1 homolog [Zingiber officinale]XP_042378187.1 PRKR-interacting protein 1 homolog [Zingiber officinale]XP_042378188.1 PRKR-interacting protein 1 homolog [Zingiber officinale]XP_042378189.1 PRKR-interacting protein 1 homolog [Zingiber officinale]KAG6515581.1 hypothetical protein ZIOFF_026010 [Zingiber officinale]